MPLLWIIHGSVLSTVEAVNSFLYYLADVEEKEPEADLAGRAPKGQDPGVSMPLLRPVVHRDKGSALLPAKLGAFLP